MNNDLGEGNTAFLDCLLYIYVLMYDYLLSLRSVDKKDYGLLQVNKRLFNAIKESISLSKYLEHNVHYL